MVERKLYGWYKRSAFNILHLTLSTCSIELALIMFHCEPQSPNKTRCIFSESKYVCRAPVSGIICNYHLDFLFSLSLVKNRVLTSNVAKTKTYLAVTSNIPRDKKLIPFPYSIRDGKVCRDPNIDSIIGFMQNWVMRLDVDEAEACRLTQILSVLFSEQLVAPEVTGAYSDFTLYTSGYNSSMLTRYNKSTILAYSGNTSTTLEMSAMPKIIKMLLYHAEASVNTFNGTETYSQVPRLLLDLDKQAIVLINDEIPTNPLLCYDESKEVDVATNLVFVGSCTDDINVLFSRTLVNFHVVKLGIATC